MPIIVNNQKNTKMSYIGEYINRRMSSIDLEKELLELIGKYNRYRNSYLIVYAGAIGKLIPDVTISMDDYYLIYDMLNNVSSPKLDFYIETPGGSGEAAEEIVTFLRSKFSNVEFVVSGEAKSAGTLMVLSGDEILMTKSGSLGPIDAQIKVGRSIVSAYDYIEWIDQKRKEAEKNEKLNPFDATMIAQISPGELSGVMHSLKFAEDLVVGWLPKYKFKNWNVTETRKIQVTQEMKEKRAKEIAEILTNHSKWRSHGRSIKIEDLANEVHLIVKKIDDNSQLSDIVYRIQAIVKLLFGSTNVYKIFATEKEKIFKNATPVENVPRIPRGIVPSKVAVVDVEVVCQKCGKPQKLYAKFVPDKKIDDDFTKKGHKEFPRDNKFKCDCGFEMDIGGIRNQIESQVGKKIVAS